jgi:hypothetical protein
MAPAEFPEREVIANVKVVISTFRCSDEQFSIDGCGNVPVFVVSAGA